MSENEEQWRVALGQSGFRERISFHRDYPDNTEIAFNSGENALGCLRCKAASPLEPCANCGNGAFKVGSGTDHVTGLFCNRCRKGFTSWACRSCGTDNPITWETVLSKGKSGGCFIATAVFGDYNAPEVVFLRVFRDESLGQSAAGRGFIQAYYAVSPSLATFIAKSELLRGIVRKLFLQPTIFLLRYFKCEERDE